MKRKKKSNSKSGLTRRRVAAAVLLTFAAVASAQDRTQLLDVVVTDSAGHPVPDLSAADFEISLDGRPQHILDCSYETAKPDPQPSAAARRMVLVIDDLNLSPQGADQIRQNLRRYANEQLRPGDEAVIMRTSAGTGGRQQFTSDPAVLRAAIDRIRPRSIRGPTPDSRFAVGALGILELAFDGLRTLPGRKSVVLFTEAKPSGSAALEDLAERANRSFAVFYAINPTGTDTTFREVAPPADPPRRSISPLIATAREESPGSILEALAKATGGLVLDRGGIASEFARVLEDRQDYYLLRYSRDFALFRPETGEQLVEHITVKSSRDGLTIRTRNGFPRLPSINPPATSEERLIDALLSPFSTAGIRDGLSALFVHTAKEGAVLKLMFHVDGRDITFRKALNGVYHYGIEAAFMTLGEGDARTVHVRVHLGDVPMSEAQHKEALEHGTSFEVRLLVSHPGPYQLRLALGDQMSDRVGSAYQFVSLPDVASGQLMLSGITLSGSVPGDPPVIHLNSSQPLLAACEVYNLAHGPDNRSEIELQSHLMFGPNEVTAATERLVPFGPSDDPSHRAVISRINLGSALPPGVYTLELTVTDKLAKSPRSATGEISFEIPKAP